MTANYLVLPVFIPPGTNKTTALMEMERLSNATHCAIHSEFGDQDVIFRPGESYVDVHQRYLDLPDQQPDEAESGDATGADILDLPMEANDAKADTVREYLKALLTRLWSEEEGFSGKRPFGNSGWTHDLYHPLVKAGVIDGKLDDDGYIESFDKEAGDQLIFDAIDAL